MSHLPHTKLLHKSSVFPRWHVSASTTTCIIDIHRNTTIPLTQRTICLLFIFLFLFCYFSCVILWAISLFWDHIFRTRAMKQGSPASPPPPSPPQPPPTTKNVIRLQSSLTPSRLRLPSNYREPPRTPPEVVKRVVSTPTRRAKSVTPELKHSSRIKRGLVLNKAKPNEEVVGTHRGREAVEAKAVSRFMRPHAVEQFARPRSAVGDFAMKRDKEEPDGKSKKELMEKLEVSESLIKNLQSEVLALKAELEKVKGLNVELESHNRKLSKDIAAAESKVISLGGNEKVRVQLLMGLLFVIICLWEKIIGLLGCICFFSSIVFSFLLFIFSSNVSPFSTFLGIKVIMSCCCFENESGFYFRWRSQLENIRAPNLSTFRNSLLTN